MWPQSGDGKCGHSGRQLSDRCRALPTNVVICILTEPVVDAKVKVHLLKNAGHCDTLGRLAGPKVLRCTMVLAMLKRMATFTQSYAKSE